MIETSPRDPLPILPAYLDGNTALWEPVQLKYLDGNNKWLESPDIHIDIKLEVKTLNKVVGYSFTDTGENILSSNNIDFDIVNNNIYYKGILIDLTKSIQYLIDDLIILATDIPGYYIWSKPTEFGDFLTNKTNLSLNGAYIDREYTFCRYFPQNRDYNLKTSGNNPYISKGLTQTNIYKLTTDRPLDLDEIVGNTTIEDTGKAFELMKDTWPWTTDNPDTITLPTNIEKLKCFILYQDNFYWAVLSYKDTNLYSIDNLSITDAVRVRSFGSKFIEIKTYNKYIID